VTEAAAICHFRPASSRRLLDIAGESRSRSHAGRSRLQDVHLALDPEFTMDDGCVPGRQIGNRHAADVNRTIELLEQLIGARELPPKLLQSGCRVQRHAQTRAADETGGIARRPGTISPPVVPDSSAPLELWRNPSSPPGALHALFHRIGVTPRSNIWTDGSGT
jgi:hypothetical protein